MILASRGLREKEDLTTEPLGDEAAAHQVRCQAQRVHLHSLALAAVMTALALWLPVD